MSRTSSTSAARSTTPYVHGSRQRPRVRALDRRRRDLERPHPGQRAQHAELAPPGPARDRHRAGQSAPVHRSGSDGGVVRSTATSSTCSAQCDTARPERRRHGVLQVAALAGAESARQLNKGLSTLQFQSLSVDPQQSANSLQGGTQDNGTFEYQRLDRTSGRRSSTATAASPASTHQRPPAFQHVHRPGQRRELPERRPDQVGDHLGADRRQPGGLATSIRRSSPIRTRRRRARSSRARSRVWRTQDWGGNQAFLEANCPEFTTRGPNPAAVTSSRSARRARPT